MARKPKKEASLADIQELLERTNMMLKLGNKELAARKRTQRKCRSCDEVKPIFFRGLCKDCHESVRASVAEDKHGKRWVSTNGYVYTYDSSGKPVLYHRWRMAQIIGRPLEKWEVVAFKDGNKANVEDDNMYLTVKNATDLHKLICPHCDKPYIS